MFTPARMSLVQLIVLDDDVIQACAALVEEKAVHLVDRAIVAPVLREGTPAYFSSVHTSLEEISLKLHELSAWLEEAIYTAAKNPFPEEIHPPKVVESLSPAIEEAYSLRVTLEKQRKEKEEEIHRLSRISDTLQSFEAAGVTYEELSSLRFFSFVAGTISRAHVADVRRSLQHIPYHLEIRPLSQHTVSVLALFPKDVETSVRGALRSLYFSEVPIPEEYQGDAHSALDSIEFSLWMIREEMAELTRELRALKAKIAPDMLRWQRTVDANKRVLDAMQLFGKTSKTTCITGWVPRARIPSLEKKMKNALGDSVVIDISHPEEPTGLAHDVTGTDVQVPTQFRHPRFLKPFEGLVTTYGYPDYDGIDPTFFVAISFLLFFGMMFGDIGHGICLALLGFILMRLMPVENIKNTGWLLIAAGASASFFGLLYGSVFGIEFHDLAVWLLPLENIGRLLVTAIMIGVCIISFGIILNILQAFKRKNVQEALFGQWGLFSGVFYWLALCAFYLLIIQKKEISFGIAIGVLLLPIVLIVVGDLLYARLFVHKKDDESHDEHEEHSLAEVIFKPVEITLGFMTHTISFVRVGAFALNHAALMMVVYNIAEMGGGISGEGATFNSRLSYILAAIGGNLLVIALEGLVVFIQCLRLEYYEFFSKFFGGEGTPYAPLRVDDV